MEAFGRDLTFLRSREDFLKGEQDLRGRQRKSISGRGNTAEGSPEEVKGSGVF